MEQEFKENLVDVFEIDEINFEDVFREYDSWDSLTNISLIAMLDDEYDIIIDTKDFQNIKTVGELFEEVKKRTS